MAMTWHVDGNRLRIVHQPEERLQAVLDMIASARETIDLFFYIVANDRVGGMVRDALIAAQARGVMVTMGMDSFGSSSATPAFFNDLALAGADLFRFSPRWSVQFLVRNHQKMLIVDGRAALIGGFNLADAYFALADPKSCWEDLGLMVEGPAVAALSRYFRQLRVISARRHTRLRDLRRLARRWRQENAPTCDARLHFLLGGPSARMSGWALSLKHDLEQANRLDLCTAYFAPGHGLLKRMGRVAARGGARLILAGRTDNPATIGAARFLYDALLRRGCRLYEYQPRLLHLKLLVLDDIVYIGSANLDLRSLFINLELMARIRDRDMADAMRGLIDRLEHDSTPQTPALQQARRGWWNRLRWALSYFLVSVLDYRVTRRLAVRAAALPPYAGRSAADPDLPDS